MKIDTSNPTVHAKVHSGAQAAGTRSQQTKVCCNSTNRQYDRILGGTRTGDPFLVTAMGLMNIRVNRKPARNRSQTGSEGPPVDLQLHHGVSENGLVAGACSATCQATQIQCKRVNGTRSLTQGACIPPTTPYTNGKLYPVCCQAAAETQGPT